MPKPRTFIFIHGAWHAAWCWQRITQPLMHLGHRVLAPDLPGHGTLYRTASTVSFNDYLIAITELIQQQPEPVTLVGHSMAGIIIAQLAENLASHIDELIFIAAYIPQNKQSLISIAKESDSHQLSPHMIVDHTQSEIRLPPSPALIPILFNRCHEQDAQYALTKLQTQPLQPFMAEVTLGKNFINTPKRAFICCNDNALLVSDQRRMSQAATDHIIELAADHSAYYSATDTLVSELQNQPK